MFNVGFAELLAILALALIILGPGKLPDAVRTAGRVMGELRRISGDFQRELRNALEDHEVDEEFERLSDTRAAAPSSPGHRGGLERTGRGNSKDSEIDDEPDGDQPPETDRPSAG